MKGKRTALIILDGWGHGDKSKSDAIYQSNTSFIDSLYKQYPNSELLTFGKHVGLPEGQMGNSEVGHINIGAGRVIYQDLEKINIACKNNSIENMQSLKNTLSYAKETGKALHLIGLVSDGGIHSHQEHLYKLCELASKSKIKNVFVHAFTDGRDCDPKSGKQFIKSLEKNLFGAKIATICGRYYAMDRDARWGRIKIAYNLMVHSKGEMSTDLCGSIDKSYENNTTDEFIKPIVHIDKQGDPIGKIQNKDAVICFNFRTDRCRQITTALTQKEIKEFQMNPLDLHYTTMTNYDDDFKNINVIYEKGHVVNTIGEVIEKNGLSQIRIAETEKYPHVTFFFSGGREEEFAKEKRLMIDSPKVATYDLQPEMSAFKVTETIIPEIKKREANFICLNFANPDMVGHTGDYNAIIKAIEVVDKCAEKVVQSILENNYACIIIADHGNAEFVMNKDGTPNTAHTINPVPCFAINTGYNNIADGKLCDIAPTILKIMGVDIPKEMNGNILIQ